METDGCVIDLPDSKCGDKTGRIFYSSPNFTCGVCREILHTETDIEADTDSDFQPGESDGTDGEGEDDEATSSSAPLNPLDVQDTPEEKMERDTQKQLREIIEEISEGQGDTDVYTSFFINNFDEIVSFYMMFTKYGPYQTLSQISSKKSKIIEVSCAYMMMELKTVRFKLLGAVTGYSEPSLIQAALAFIRTYKGEEYREGAYLIEVYAPALKVQENFLKPMKDTWLNIAHPRGKIRDKVVAFIGAFLRISEVSITQVAIQEATGVSRTSLSPKLKQYEAILKKHFNL